MNTPERQKLFEITHPDTKTTVTIYTDGSVDGLGANHWFLAANYYPSLLAIELAKDRLCGDPKKPNS